MRRILLFVFSVLMSVPFFAQADDPVVMNVNGYEVKKSEFEYFFKKNNTEDVITKKTIKQYADLYLNFKLKVQAAISDGADKSEAFQEEYKMYRDLQAESYLVDNNFLEGLAKEMYENTYAEVGPDGLVQLSIMRMFPDPDDDESLDKNYKLMCEAYDKLWNGAEFEDVAREYPQFETVLGGDLGWLSRVGLPEQVRDVVAKMGLRECCEPFVMDDVVYLIKLVGIRTLPPYEVERANILEWMKESSNYYTEARYRKANEYAEKLGWDVRNEEAALLADSLLEEIEPEFGYLSKEYYDGLLMFDASSKAVWSKLNNDTEGMKKWFDANKKNFSFDGPRFKGMVFFCTEEKVFHDLEARLAGVNVEDWVDTIVAYNTDAIYARVMKGPQGNGIFKEGQNAYVDNLVFGLDTKGEPVKNFPYVNVIGKVIDRPESMYDVLNQVSDGYQSYLEKEWVKKLRKQYKYKIYKKALKQVNIDK